MTGAGNAIVGVIIAVLGVAIVAVLVSQRAQTPSVIQAGGSALAAVIGAAVSPIGVSTSNNFGSAALVA